MTTFINRCFLALFCAFCVAYPIALIGVAFDVHLPFSMTWFGSFLLILEGALLAFALMDEYGPVGLLVTLLIALLAYGVEALGAVTGFPFGAYRYTDVLFPRLPGSVPLAVIFAWLLMLIAVRGLTVRPPLMMGGSPLVSLFFAAVCATLLDLEFEPVAFHLEHYWVWLAPGNINYYGVPLINFIAWFVVALAVSFLVNGLLSRAISFQNITSFTSRLPLNAPTWLYFANVFMFGLVDLTHGYYIGVGVAVLAAILPFVIAPLPGTSPLPIIAAFGVEQDQAFQPATKRVKKTRRARKKRR